MRRIRRRWGRKEGRERMKRGREEKGGERERRKGGRKEGRLQMLVRM
jgi:hypothetical protein